MLEFHNALTIGIHMNNYLKTTIEDNMGSKLLDNGSKEFVWSNTQIRNYFINKNADEMYNKIFKINLINYNYNLYLKLN